MNKLSKITFNTLSVMVLVALSAVFVASVIMVFVLPIPDWHYKLALVLGLCILSGMGVLCTKLKSRNKLLLILGIAFVLRLWWMLTVNSVPTSDLLLVYNAAKGFTNGKVGALRDYGYLARFPHLVPMMLYMAGMIKAFGTYHIFAMKCVSVVLSVTTVYLVYLLSGYYVKKENSRLVAALIASVWPSFVSYSSTFCTETIGVPLFILSVILFHRAINSEKNRTLNFAICGAVLCFSNMFRAVAVIFLIAFIIYMLIFVSKSKITGIASILVGYLCVSLVVSTLLMAGGVTEQPLWKGKEPSYATLMLKGSNFEYGGAWNPEDARFVTEHLGDENLSSMCFEKISERLREKSIWEIAWFYSGKFIMQWTVGDCGGTFWATLNTNVPSTNLLPMPFQFVYIAVVFLSICAFLTRKKHSPMVLMMLLLCGFGAAFVMLETQARYSYIVSWVFVILAAYGTENLTLENKYAEKIWNLYTKYKMQINYIAFGGVTTVVNVVVYYVLYTNLNVPNIPSTIVAWLASVIVAYVTNKIWVFESKSFKLSLLAREMTSFFGCRLLTCVFDVGIMWIGVDVLMINSTLVKIISNVVVVVLNYILSKLIIFKNTDDKTRECK